MTAAILAKTMPTTNATYNLFLTLPTIGKEKKGDEISVRDLKKRDELDKRIPIFYNINVPSTAGIRLAEKVTAEQMSLIRPEHVLYHVDSVGVKFSLPDTVSFRHYPELKYPEESTLQSLWQHCRENKSEKVIYLRSGLFMDTGHQLTEAANYFASGALSTECGNLSNGCNVCGTRMTPIPHPHIIGNTWSARCDYVARLQDPLAFGEEMKRIAPKRAHCRGVGFFAGLHWIASHPDVVPCDLHPSSSFAVYRDALELSSVGYGYEPELKFAPRFELSYYAKRPDLCKYSGESVKQRLDEYRELYGITPPKSWWGWDFFGSPYKDANET